MKKVTLKAGNVLFHGTDNDDFIDAEDSLDGPAWLSSSRSVAEYFAHHRAAWGGQKRIISYLLSEDIQLVEILGPRQMHALAEKHGLSLCGVEEIRESIVAAGLPGWVIPNNYQDGDDILIVDTGVLEYRETELLDVPAPRSRD